MFEFLLSVPLWAIYAGVGVAIAIFLGLVAWFLAEVTDEIE